MIFQALQICLIVFEVLLIFNLLIIVHELGHFLAARWRGLHVDKFGIWFGRPLWKRKIKGVEFSLGWIPAGGFVILPQMAPMEAIEGRPQTGRTSLPPARPTDKIIVAFAGPLFSFFLALVFAVIVWITGRPMTEGETTTTIGYVEPNLPAAKAGFKPGDQVLEVDGHPVEHFHGMTNSIVWYIVRSEGSTIPFKVRRGDETFVINSGFDHPTSRSWGRKSLREVGLDPKITPIVAKVAKGSPADLAGLDVNDQIVAVSGETLYHPNQLSEWYRAHPGQPLLLTVRRGDRELPVTLKPGHLIISSITPNSPAQVAGLEKHDRLLAVDGQPVFAVGEISKIIENNPGKSLSLSLERDGKPLEVKVLPAVPDDRGKNVPPRAIIGFKADPESASGAESDSSESSTGITWDASGLMVPAHVSPFDQITASVQTISNTLGALFSQHSDIRPQHMSGPIMIMRTYYALFQDKYSWQLALWFSVVFNVNLAMINLLPIPVLDGGHIVLALLEAIRRRPINVRVLEVMQGACAILIIGFMLYISFYDFQDLRPRDDESPVFRTPAAKAPN